MVDQLFVVIVQKCKQLPEKRVHSRYTTKNLTIHLFLGNEQI